MIFETFLDYSQFQWMLLGDDDLYNSYEKALYNRRLSINDMIKKLMLEGQLGEMQSDEMALISKVIKLSKEMDTMKNYIISFYTPLPDTVVANFDKKLELRKELCKTLK